MNLAAAMWTLLGVLVGCPLVAVGLLLAGYFFATRCTTIFVMWFITKVFYRIEVVGGENVPTEGGGILAPNHISWMDGVLMSMASPRLPKFVVWAPITKQIWAIRLTRVFGVIPVEPSASAARDAIRRVRENVGAGELMCVFPEGAISRTGQLMPFQRGLLAMNRGVSAPIVPVYIGGMWGSLFSNERGCFFWKWPRVWRRPLQIHFGKPLTEVKSVEEVRQAVQELERQYMTSTGQPSLAPPQQFLRQCRNRGGQVKLADSLGQSMTGMQLLLRTLVMRRILRRHFRDDEKNVGVLLPSSAVAAMANAALAIDRKVAINLNYTISSGMLAKCLETAGIRTVITSKRFLQKVNLEVGAQLLYLEDLKDQATSWDKISAAFATYCLPTAMIERSLGLHHIQPNDLLTIVFTSGSTGEPKGVMLSHGNVMSNVMGFNDIVRLTKEDVLLGVLPFFHSFGYTATLWSVLLLNMKGVYHPNPLEASQIGKLAAEHKATVLLAAPTFLRSYLRKCEKEQFQYLEVVVAGAEKLPKELSDGFEEKFGVRPSEGYGCTETSPVVSVNVPIKRTLDSVAPSSRDGSVGRPIPGVQAMVVDADTMRPLASGEIGMLLIGGSGVMQGYYKQPELTAKAMHQGWYITGDLATIDEEGFIHIAGRLSRFSKIGGEMVPHIRVEEAIKKTLGSGPEELDVAITSIPDPRKGEKLVVLHTALAKSPEEICKGLAAEGLPNLFIPSPDAFWQVEAIPVLGTGKLDLRGLKKMAEERAQSSRAAGVS